MSKLAKLLVAGLIVSGPALPSPVLAAGDTAASEKVVAEHLAAFGRGDIEALLADLSDDYVFVMPDGVVSGRDAIRPLLAAILAEFGKPGVAFRLLSQHCAGEVCQIVWTADTPDNSYELGTDTFIIRDGRIVAQSFAAKAVPKAR